MAVQLVVDHRNCGWWQGRGKCVEGEDHHAQPTPRNYMEGMWGESPSACCVVAASGRLPQVRGVMGLTGRLEVPGRDSPMVPRLLLDCLNRWERHQFGGWRVERGDDHHTPRWAWIRGLSTHMSDATSSASQLGTSPTLVNHSCTTLESIHTAWPWNLSPIAGNRWKIFSQKLAQRAPSAPEATFTGGLRLVKECYIRSFANSSV